MTDGADRPGRRSDEDDHPVVVLVPGLGLDARSWHLVRAALTTRVEVVTLPSMGRRAPRGCDLHVEQQADRLLQALPRGRDVVLVGHSAGCPVVVEAAARSPHVLGVVLVGPVTDPRARTWPRMLAGWLATAPRERPSEVPSVLPQYRSTGAGSMLRGMNQMRRYRTHVGLAAVPVPVHVVRGEHDRIARQDWCTRLAGLGAGEVTSVPAGAHMVPLTHPGAVVAGIERLLARVGPVSRR
ncbi:alpha/beta fold hydrolase [Oryzobacter terrae]|uniref:alpha/beta fold hydrolase n=1 Tax=Oryzobacter terrae TaxID=1620385 RepID=UPI003672D553